MKIGTTFVLMVGVVLGMTSPAPSGEAQANVQGGEILNEQILKAMTDYVSANKRYGVLRVSDEQTGRIRKLEFIDVQNNVHKIAQGYYACANFKDRDSGESVDLDFDVVVKEGTAQVSQVLIHHVNGVERFTYDEQGNRVAVRQ
jgi:hypothetical protein